MVRILVRRILIKESLKFYGNCVVGSGLRIRAVLDYIGDKLGLYKAMKNAGRPITSDELTNMTQTAERNIRE